MDRIGGCSRDHRHNRFRGGIPVVAISTVRFGRHWDEWKIIEGVQETITSGVVLPAGYNSPSLTYLIALFTSLANLPAVVEAGSVAAAKGQLADIVGSPPFTYQLRAVFAVLTASTGLFAVLAARATGTSWLAASISGAMVLSSFPPVAAATLLALNWPIFLYAAASMYDLDVESWRRSIATYVAEHPDRRFAVSPGVAALLFEQPEARSAVTVYPPERSDAYIYVLGEHHARIANRRNTYRVVAGSDDVDLDYYPTWLGLERIVVVDGPVASLLTGLLFVGKAEVRP